MAAIVQRWNRFISVCLQRIAETERESSLSTGEHKHQITILQRFCPPKRACTLTLLQRFANVHAKPHSMTADILSPLKTPSPHSKKSSASCATHYIPSAC